MVETKGRRKIQRATTQHSVLASATTTSMWLVGGWVWLLCRLPAFCKWQNTATAVRSQSRRVTNILACGR